ncbi:four helix bundle protein [Vaginella massiliensis]|uniref:four helix bundle protein n=1 Tax=Vaginella massiliensis TaxID=1816680 RepID=UPI002936E557|nr:four helix bundle protein [Vaginella massiliensis]
MREAQNAESNMDFIHKLAIAQKECDETLYGVELLYKANYIAEADFSTVYSMQTKYLKCFEAPL